MCRQLAILPPALSYFPLTSHWTFQELPSHPCSQRLSSSRPLSLAPGDWKRVPGNEVGTQSLLHVPTTSTTLPGTSSVFDMFTLLEVLIKASCPSFWCNTMPVRDI